MGKLLQYVHNLLCCLFTYLLRELSATTTPLQFEWVKWITRVEVLTEPDAGQVVSIFTSSFTDAGRGKS